jgi:hypothetical protein
VMALYLSTIWLLGAILLGYIGVFAARPFPYIPLSAFVFCFGLLLLYWKFKSVREEIFVIGYRPVLAVHITRLIGIYYFMLFSEGRLPWTLGAVGLATSVVGLWSIALFLWSRTAGKSAWIHLFIWNSVGIVVSLLVAFFVGFLSFTDPQSIEVLTSLPLSVRPTFLVPLILASHVILFVRLRESKKQKYLML